MHTAMDDEKFIRLRGKLKDQSRQITALTAIIRDMEVLNDQLIERHEQYEWFRKVAMLLLRQPKWGRVSRALRDNHIRSSLAAHGLFDGGAYLKRHPDVAAEGADPLQHYILHGMAEGRERAAVAELAAARISQAP